MKKQISTLVGALIILLVAGVAGASILLVAQEEKTALKGDIEYEKEIVDIDEEKKLEEEKEHEEEKEDSEKGEDEKEAEKEKEDKEEKEEEEEEKEDSEKDEDDEEKGAYDGKDIREAFDITWHLKEINYYDEETISFICNNIKFTEENGQMEYGGSSCCNSYSGEFEIKAENRVALKEFTTTLMACSDSEMNKQENIFYEVIPQFDKYYYDGEELIFKLEDNQGEALFKKER